MGEANRDDITQLLLAWGQGEEEALARLMPLVYGALRKIATGYLRHERSDHTLQTSALVHEAYLRLIDQDRVCWRDRTHFFAIAAQLMRRILVDHARRHRYAKRGGGAIKIPLDKAKDLGQQRSPDLIALDEALVALDEKSTELARLVELRYFGGLTKEETAEVMKISTATVSRRWRVAKAWLYSYLETI